MFNGHHEHATFYITTRKHTQKQVTSLEVFFLHPSLRAKPKNRMFFSNLIHSLLKSIEHLFSEEDDVYNKNARIYFICKKGYRCEKY